MTDDRQSGNAFDHDLPGTAARDRAETAIEELRRSGGIFVEAVRATRMAMALTDPKLPGNPIVFANQAFLDLSGYRMEEVLGQQPYFMNGPETDPGDIARFRQILAGDGDGVVETVQYAKDGRRFVATMLLSAFADDEGKTLYHFFSWSDVTRRSRAESEAADLRSVQAALRVSEERLRDVLNSMAEGFALLGPDFTILDVNDETVRLDGRTREELIGHLHWEAFAGSAHSPLGQLFRRVMRDRVPGSIEHMYRRADGRERWIEARVYPNPEGRVACFWRDITERKQAEAALRDSEEQYRMLFETIDEGFAVMQAVRDDAGSVVDMVYLRANRAWERQAGFALEPGRKASELFPGSVDPDRIGVWTSVVDTGEACREEHHVAATGRWYENHYWRVGGPDSDLIAAIFDDVTPRRRAEDDLRERVALQRFRAELGDTLRLLSDGAEIERATVELLGRELGASRVFYASMDPGGETWSVTHDYSDGLPSNAGRYPLTGFQEARLNQWRLGQMSSVSDSEADPGLNAGERAAYAAFGARAAVGVPLVDGGRFVALLVVNQTAPRGWTPTELALIRETAERAWLAIERARAEAALRESEERLRQFGEASQDLLWIRDAAGLQWTYLTPAFEDIYGVSREIALAGDSYGRWLDLVVPEDRARVMGMIDRVRAGERVTVEYRILRPGDGTLRWLRDTDFPIRDDEGRVIGIGGIGHDITARREADERQDILLAELQHRVRNILAVIRSIVSRSDDGARSTQDYVQHLQGRLSALAHTQVLLTRRAGAGVDLQDLIHDEFLGQAARDGQFTIDGPPIQLSPKAAEVLALAIHELATNATKYGAFARADGRLAVKWTVEQRDGQAWLLLDWTERNVAIVDAVPRRQGFGSELIFRRIPYELKGHGSFVLKPGGLHSTIEFPLLPGDSILQTDGGDR